MTLSSIVPHFATAVEVFTAFLAALIFLSSVDDLHIDVRYWWRRLMLRLGRRTPARQPTREEIARVAQAPVVILVPAWHESAVIRRMLLNTTRALHYDNYMVFVGTYPNDPATAAEVRAVAAHDRRIRLVELPHAGPTCKADCLNHIVEEVLDYERTTGISFAAFVLHDSEDALHPLELQYFNAMLPQYDMLQLPVIALERAWSQLVAGTYMDEFAESHGKEMLVRQSLCGTIPSAGVGTCFSRAAVLALWRESHGEPFRTDSLTEDYEIGMRLSHLGMRTRFVLITPDDARRDERASLAARMLSVREYFPHEFSASCRQKARWILGIGLQAWHHVPFQGRSWPLRYMMLRDRKGIFTSLIPAGAYGVALFVLLLYVGVWAGWWAPQAPVLFREGSPWMLLLYANLGFVLLRAGQRAYFTGAMYGWRQGLASLPRMVVGNVINCFAALRAWRLYLVHRISGKALAWDKTAHEFPESGFATLHRQ